MTDHSVPNDDDHEHRGLDRWDPIWIGFVALLAALTWFRVWQRVSRFDALAIAGLVVGGWPIWREALEALFERSMTMELSMTIAIGAAAVIGEFFTALVIVLFVLVAEVLGGLTVGRGHKAIKQLVDLLPRVALVRRAGAEYEVSADELQVGELILVKPGARIPIDGIGTGWHSFVDQATITGESMPVEKLVGEQVFAGTINQSGALEIRTTGIGRDTASSKRSSARSNRALLFIHVASELTFILNSTRLLPRTQGVAVGPAAPLQDRRASTGRIAA